MNCVSGTYIFSFTLVNKRYSVTLNFKVSFDTGGYEYNLKIEFHIFCS